MSASAPASSANLGHGFDTLALALDMRCKVDVSPADDWIVESGDSAFVRKVAANVTDVPHRISVKSDIPIGKGLGSSAAVAAALGAALRPEWIEKDRGELHEFVSKVEGHPDNAAAAVHGGLVSVALDGRVLHLDMHDSYRVVLTVPDVMLPTSEARAAMPQTVPVEVAARTAARAIMLIEALRDGDHALLASIGSDELHEPYRARLRPVIYELVAAAQANNASLAVISGAGPSVLAISTVSNVAQVVAGLEGQLGDRGRVFEVDVAREGVRVEAGS